MVPFLIVGMKKDKTEKLKITKEESNKLLYVLKQHMKCELTQTSAENPDDISKSLHQLMSLASSHLFPHY
jgi:hypothetical protein